MRIRRVRHWLVSSLLWLGGVSAVPLAAGEHALVRLSRTLEREFAELADGRAIDLVELDDRSGRDLGRDLRSLLRPLASGRHPALRAEGVLVESPGRLTVSARVTDPENGELVGLLTASEALDDDWLDLRSLPSLATRNAIDVVERSLSGPLPETVVDIAWLGQRLLLLSPARLRLADVRGEEIEVRHELALPGTDVRARAPAGRLQPSEDGLVWALSNRRDSALLVEARGARLEARGSADALPAQGVWPSLRFRPGTNELVAQGDPGWRLLRVAGNLGVDSEGELVAASAESPIATGLGIGSALCPLWQGLWLASGATPPDRPDSLLVLATGGPSPLAVERFETPGTVVAVAARLEGDRARVAVVVEAFGAQRLLLLELARRETPDLPEPAP